MHGTFSERLRLEPFICHNSSMAIPPLNIIRDPRRLATLEDYGIVGTPREPVFDDLVRIAKEVCRTPSH